MMAVGRWLRQEDAAPRQGATWGLPHLALPSTQRKTEISLAEAAIRAEGPLLPDDTNLVRLLRSHYLHPPDDLPYVLKEDGGRKELPYTKYKIIYPSWTFIDGVLHDLFAGQPPGFFVEAGALDGEFLSNTLQLERRHGWTGLLVEAERENYSVLRGKHRKAWSSNSCISTKPFPQSVILTSFRRQGLAAEWLDRGAARIEEDPTVTRDGPGYKTFQRVQCFPAPTFLLALNVSRVQFFSLDVEGVEMDILRSFPFDKVIIDVWAIEHIGRPRNDSLTSSGGSSHTSPQYEDPEFIAFMESRGYYLFDMFCHLIPDYVFIRRESEIFERLGVPQHLWRRRGICLNKTAWDEDTRVFQPELHRDGRHWPNIVFSG